MTTSNSTNATLWIRSPLFDLIFFIFGWFAVVAAFFAVDHFNPAARFGSQHLWNLNNSWVAGIIAAVMVVNFVHRNVTHVLVYGDEDIFKERKKSYLFLPPFLLALLLLALFWKVPSLAPNDRPLFVVLLLLTAVWNFYHTLMQKVGFLRIYAQKSGGGSPLLDRAILITWFIFLVLAMADSPAIRLKVSLLTEAMTPAIRFAVAHASWIHVLKQISLFVSCVISVFYIDGEWKRRNALWSPKNIFLISVLMLYAAFAWDFVIAYAAFGFSHALEYVAFVALFVKKKYQAPNAKAALLHAVAQNSAVWMSVFCTMFAFIYLSWNHWSPRTLALFYIGTSFLHYLYDGWIWKIRKPSVGSPMGIRYPAPQAS